MLVKDVDQASAAAQDRPGGVFVRLVLKLAGHTVADEIPPVPEDVQKHNGI
jgi:hypothetical protein